MLNVDDIARQIVGREGGFVDDPDDPGGATNFGVTIHTMRRLALDLDGDGDVDRDDVKALTKDRAIEIFKNHYFFGPGLDGLPQTIQASVFDMYVNAGGNAIRILQRLLGQFGLPVGVDGALGPETRAAAAKLADIAPDHHVDAYGIARRNYYYQLADKRPASRKYARRRDGGKGGWIVRAEEFIASKYHYTLDDHKRRCAQWD